MKKFIIGVHKYKKFCFDEWLTKVLTKFSEFNSSWGLNIQLPYKIAQEEVVISAKKKKNFFGKEKVIRVCKYKLCLYFHKDLTEQEILFWKGFTLGTISV